MSRKEQVNHPSHYGGKENPYEVIKVLEAWGLVSDAYLFNVVKYIARAGKKTKDTERDLRKALWYLNRRTEKAKKSAPTAKRRARPRASKRRAARS